MAKFLLLSNVLAAVFAPVLVQGMKIAFVGDTGMEGTSTVSEPNLFSQKGIVMILMFDVRCIVTHLLRRGELWIW
jgi:hypothetical protein